MSHTLVEWDLSSHCIIDIHADLGYNTLKCIFDYKTSVIVFKCMSVHLSIGKSVFIFTSVNRTHENMKHTSYCPIVLWWNSCHHLPKRSIKPLSLVLDLRLNGTEQKIMTSDSLDMSVFRLQNWCPVWPNIASVSSSVSKAAGISKAKTPPVHMHRPQNQVIFSFPLIIVVNIRTMSYYDTLC